MRIQLWNTLISKLRKGTYVITHVEIKASSLLEALQYKQKEVLCIDFVHFLNIRRGKSLNVCMHNSFSGMPIQGIFTVKHNDSIKRRWGDLRHDPPEYWMDVEGLKELLESEDNLEVTFEYL